jgi:hypothetical protein
MCSSGCMSTVQYVRYALTWSMQFQPRRLGTRRTRSAWTRLEVRRQFFSQRVVENWNEIPEKVKSSGSVIGFKAGLKKHLQGRMDPVQ